MLGKSIYAYKVTKFLSFIIVFLTQRDRLYSLFANYCVFNTKMKGTILSKDSTSKEL